MKNNKESVDLILSEKTLNKLKILARKRHTSIDQVVEDILKIYSKGVMEI